MSTTTNTPAGSPPAAGRYTFDNATPEAANQVRLLAEILDDHSTSVLARLDPEPGWRCLDLGSGAGSVATWLASRVSPTGRVTAIDTDPRHIPTHDLVHIRQGDATELDLGDKEYDLIHARLLTMHLEQRRTLLGRMTRALKPGGLLVLSEWDCTNTDTMLLRGTAEAAQAFAAFQEKLLALAVTNGASLNWAREVPLAMHHAGLIDIESEVHSRLWAGGEAGCLLHASNSRQMESALLAAGMTTAYLTTLRRAMSDPATLTWMYPMVTTVGRRAEN
ncbi:methyltransferase family protein [Micromonospora pisi]|uniref:Methyltransferase family protein n=1 Tax=Micromonospora pisi TaxID=589240 RepID=A0A495JJB5_9ACTN|nr:class I SAM-dependent methyltransferase [Micromonospora pisi]RKR88412.1 methyltransferase family protein [Micromonospora pisi]